ncbi:unnamed protein product [Cunninghamella blakesleeana]
MQTKRKTGKNQEYSEGRGRKRTRDNSTDKVKMSLKKILVDDWESFTKEQQVNKTTKEIHLPAKITVADILERYLQEKEGSDGHDEILEQTIEGLKLYFNHSVRTMLLYRSERNQYFDLQNSHSDKLPTDLYGAIHLLRLFVELPILMNGINIDDETLELLRSTFMDILLYIQDNEKDFFI